jgi:hypothetical protein
MESLTPVCRSACFADITCKAIATASGPKNANLLVLRKALKWKRCSQAQQRLTWSEPTPLGPWNQTMEYGSIDVIILKYR